MHDLEITPSQIARLVLGYLKSERCDGAYEEFLKTSKHLKELKGRIITRVDHKTLGDFLSEYSQLNILIQERIEETNFYNEHNSATTLVDQLGYLLNCNNGGRIRASTPIHNSSTDVAVNTDHVCEIRATSLEDLPGNTETKEDAPLPNTHETDTEEGAAVAKNNGNTAAQDVEAAIKNIVQKATSDPFFDKVVKEVIGDDVDGGAEGENKTDIDGNVRFHSTQPQNSVVVNTNNVLMVQTAPSTMGAIDMTKPCYVINSTPQPIYTTGNVLSDQDIMSMPIMVCDDKRDKQGGVGQFIIPTNVNQQVAPTYLVNLTANNDLPSTTTTSIQFYQNDQPRKLKPIREKRRRIVPTTISRPDPIKILPEPSKTTITEATITIQIPEPVVVADEEPKPKPPPPPPPLCTPSNDGGGGGTTPRSGGSHVRALDFSTPQKLLEVEPIKKDKEPKPSWDSDLRGLIQSSPEREKKKKEVPPKGGKKKKKQKLNKTAEEGELIEKALCEEKKREKEDGSKLVLSPSKLSSSCKRNIVDLTDTDEKKTPPEKAVDLSGVKKNLIDSLQTPVKIDTVCPKTPGCFSPITNTDTPFTKVLKEQLHGIDLSSIPTPKFPVTPSFLITPSMDANYANRPTDYSSSSSYYQPSDNENNRSIEQLIEECNRLEREIPSEKQIKILDDVILTPGTDLKAVAEQMKSMSKNVIGRKNLRLVEPATEDLESSCSTCSSATTSSSDTENEESNQTVIAKQTTQRYSLRLRKNASTTATETTTTTEAITSILSNVQVKTTLEVGKTHEEILTEMEEKRKKTIEKLEKDQKEADEKKRKVVEKKKAPTVKKTPVRRGRKTKLEPPQSTSTPSVAAEKKKRAANDETEKLVGDLKSILNTTDDAKEEGTTKKTRRRSSAKNSDESATKTKLDVSLDEETEKLLENLCKPKKMKLSVETEKSEPAKNSDKPVKNENGVEAKKEAKTDENKQNVVVEKIEKKEETGKESVEVDKNKKAPSKKPERKDATNKRVENKKKSSELDKPKKRQKTTGEKPSATKNTVDLDKNKKERKTPPETADKFVEPNKSDTKVAKTEESQEKSVELELEKTKVDTKEDLVVSNKNEKVSNETKIESKKDLVASNKIDKVSNETKKDNKKDLVVSNKNEKVSNETKIESKKDLVASNKIEKVSNETKIDSKKDLVESNKTEKVSIDKSHNKHETVELKETKEKQKVIITNTETDVPVKKTESDKQQQTNNSENKRSHVEKVYEKLFGDFGEEENQTDSTNKPQNSQPIGEQYEKLVGDLVAASDDSFTKQQEDDANKAKELEKLLLESEETAPEKLVNDLKERGIHLVHNKTSPPQKEDTKSLLEQQQQLQQNDLELLESEFSVCLFHRENVHYKHDPYIRPNKKMSDYDFSLLTKEMNATVYLAEFDAEVQKVMTCTPFESLLEIPSKIDVMPKKKPTPKPQKPNPLELLNKQLDAQNQKIATNSPLENLYDDDNDGKTSNKTADGVVVRKKAPGKKSDHKRARSLSNSHDKKPEEPTRKSSRIKNRRSSEPKPNAAEEVDNNKTEEVCKDEAEDELMNYAAVGTPEKCLKKRKLDEKPEGHHMEKKLKPEKCKELLKDIDVDEFLTHLHGDT